MILLSNEQIKEIRELQGALDARIRKEHNIPDEQNLSLEKYLALKTEFFEFVNEVESFKYWKTNKGKAHILEEACDTLHFIMSLAIDNDVNIRMEENFTKALNGANYDMNEILGITDAMISDCYAEREWSVLNGVLVMLCIALEKCNFTSEDLYNAYISKNAENHARQDNKY